MCELFGFTSNHAADIREYLKEFYSHSPMHPHGWGIMREHNGKREIFKEAVCASESQIISKIIEETQPQTNAAAHIRMATIGYTKYDNCHPFIGTDNTGRCWTLNHNGTIYSGKKLIKYLYTQTGDTDSERILLALIDEINEKNPRTDHERFEAVEQFIISLSKRNKLNLIIYDGDYLYIHQNMKDTLYYKSDNGSIVFATVPLDNDKWKNYPLTQLCAFSSGKKVFEGTKHDNVFVPSLEYITTQDAMHI